MLWSGDFSLEKVISAVLTFAIILFALRAALGFANRKAGKQIEQPDWIDEKLADKLNDLRKKRR